MKFPRIQGADCCGQITRVGSAIDPARIGERVLVRTMQEITLGSEIDGAFAEYLCVRGSEAFVIDSPLADAELASFPCPYSTAEGLLQRAQVGAERRLSPGRPAHMPTTLSESEPQRQLIGRVTLSISRVSPPLTLSLTWSAGRTLRACFAYLARVAATQLRER